MNQQRYQQIKRIVATALEQPADKVEAVLQNLCANDHELRKEVDALLAIDVKDGFLQQDHLDVYVDDINLVGHIGRIKIDRLIAKGGMGEVYAGVDQLLKRPVAIKVMTAKFRMSKMRRSAFLNEAQALSSLQHPNICQVYDFFEEQGKDVLVLELIKGKTLREVIDENKLSKPVEVSCQIAEALTVAHERGIVHRDLKPDNIMITPDGQVKVLDFGLAKFDAGIFAVNNINDIKQTQIAGTPGYMSPEQAKGLKSTTATDLWNFGLVLSELLTGNTLFSKDTSATELIELSKQAKIAIPKNLAYAETKLLQQLLSVKPEDRPTARATLNSIKKIQNRSKRRLKTTSLFGLISLMIIAGWKYTTDLQQQRNIAVEAKAEAEDLIGFMLDDLHTGLKAVGKLRLLESVANKAMGYYGAFDQQRLQQSQGKPAVALLRIAEVLDEKGQKDQAIKLVKQATLALTNLHISNPEDELIIFRLGNAQMKLAELLKITGKYDEALNYSLKAIQLGKIVVNKIKDQLSIELMPKSNQRLSLYLSSLYETADIHRRMGNNSAAMENLEQALVVAMPAVEKYPNLKPYLADIHYKRCSIYYALEQKDTMLQACLSSMEFDRLLYEANPDNFLHHRNYTADHDIVANIYRSLNRYEEALQMISVGLRHSRELNIWDPDSASITNELVSSLVTKARILFELDRNEESRILFEEAYKTIVPLAKDQEEMTYLHNLLFSSMYLGYLEQAREVADLLQKSKMDTRDLRELFVQLKIFEEAKSIQ